MLYLLGSGPAIPLQRGRGRGHDALHVPGELHAAAAPPAIRQGLVLRDHAGQHVPLRIRLRDQEGCGRGAGHHGRPVRVLLLQRLLPQRRGVQVRRGVRPRLRLLPGD